MMGFWTFVLIAVAISTVATIFNNWIRARHGYPLEEDASASRISKQMTSIGDDDRDLKSRIGGMEARLRVLEKIATDPSQQIADEIEKLRDQPKG